jgi:hypothetical protein
MNVLSGLRLIPEHKFLTLGLVMMLVMTVLPAQQDYRGRYFSGSGDIEYLELLDKAYRMMRPDPELENLSMLYMPAWDGFVEGPTWDAWWIQNSFGPTYTMLPFMDKAYQTFIKNSQALWFDHIGNGIRKDAIGYAAPEGSLCDCARPDWVIYRQGDGKHAQHDWPYGFTTAGMILQGELLLISRDRDEIAKYVPLLEKCAEFIDERRDPVKNIFLVGPAANLLAPSYAGTGKLLPDNTYEKAYLAEISVNYIAGLNRLIELEKILQRQDKVELYQDRIKKIRSGFPNIMTPEGYFIRALAQNGTRHGEYGAEKHGYFETTPNHDAMAFRIVDDEQALTIYNKIKSIPGLRPYSLILPNYPGYDDMYEYDDNFWAFGNWINGGHWTTTEARMQLGYYRVGAYDDAKEAFRQILKLAPIFRLDNNLWGFGSKIQQFRQPINCVYDSWGAPGGFMRGLFEYEYKAGGIHIYPHIPPGINALDQNFPIYFGDKKIYLSTRGTGAITSVWVNGREFKDFSPDSFFLPLDASPGNVFVSIGTGSQKANRDFTVEPYRPLIPDVADFWKPWQLYSGTDEIKEVKICKKTDFRLIEKLSREIESKGYTDTYEYRICQLILESLGSVYERTQLKSAGELPDLPEVSQNAADALYISTLNNLYIGFAAHLEKKKIASDPKIKEIAKIWSDINYARL